MTIEDFQKFFSSSRVSRFLTATNNSTNRAIELYKANLLTAQAFHPLLGILEVALRNRLNDALTVHFSDPDWIINQKTGFMNDPYQTYLLSSVNKAENRLSYTTITSGKIIAEQTLGFWTELFVKHYYKLLLGTPIKAFSNLPTGYGRKKIRHELENIRLFRNRINHNEPICFLGTSINFTETLNTYKSIINIVTWIDPELVTFTNNLDNVNITIDNAKKI